MSNYGCTVTGMTQWYHTETQLEEGDVVLFVNKERCEGADDARRMLRDTCADKEAPLVLQVWHPPEEFVFPAGGEGDRGGVDEGEGEGGGLGAGAGGGIFDFDDSVTEALKMTEGDRENVRRIAIRLEQGATAANCDKICRALKVSHVNATT